VMSKKGVEPSIAKLP